jgi:hypothetical protein
MTNLHSNPLPATSWGLPASLQRSALSRACHAHNRVCYTDSRLMIQTVVFVIQIAVSICSVHRDLLCCRVCQHWLSPKESNRCENHPWGTPSRRPSPAHPNAATGLDQPSYPPATQSAGTSPCSDPRSPRHFAGPTRSPSRHRPGPSFAWWGEILTLTSLPYISRLCL